MTLFRSLVASTFLVGLATCTGTAPVARSTTPLGAAEPSALVASLPTRLRIRNQCSHTLWMQSSANLPDPRDHLVFLRTGEAHDYKIPDSGLAATRFHPKVGCDSAGGNCTLGDVGQPPIDSKLEVTWGCKTFGTDKSKCAGDSAVTDTTWWNLSQVDGYSLPYMARPFGNTDSRHGCPVVDCGGLSLSQCPAREDLSKGFLRSYPERSDVDLRVKDPKTGRVIGCLAPCYKLNYPEPYGFGLGDPTQDALAPYCCPTPPVSPSQCSSGPVEQTNYVKAIHRMCPDVYAYAYDDAKGLHTCDAGTSIELVLCPRGDGL